MKLDNLNTVITGGSSGLGLGLVEALAARGAKLTVVARGPAALEAARQRLGVATMAADVTDADAAGRILAQTQPQLLVLNAGAKPPMGRLDKLDWAAFAATWETDVKAGFHWMQAALRLPLSPGSRVLVSSSGAALNGSPLSGGYAGAKHMLWVMARYANTVSAKEGLGLRFQVLVPRQMVGGTGVGDAGSAAYAAANGISPAQFLEGFGAPMPPRAFGEKVLAMLEDPQYAQGMAFGFKGDTGITILEEATT